MEGEQEVYQGQFAGWDPKYFVLFDSVLSYSDFKGSKVQGKIHLSVASINIVEQEPCVFTIFTGINNMELCAPDESSKIRWINTFTTSQKKFLDKNLRDSQMLTQSDDYQNMKNDKINYDKIFEANPNIRSLQYGKELNVVNEKLAGVWCTQAKMNEILFSIKSQQQNETSKQFSLTELLEKYSNELKHNITVICKIVSEEREKLQKIALYVEHKYQKIETCIDQIDNPNTKNHGNIQKPTIQGSQDDHYKKFFDKTNINDETVFHSVNGGNMSAFDDISRITTNPNKVSFHTMMDGRGINGKILKKGDSYVPEGNEKATQYMSGDDKCFQTDFEEVRDYLNKYDNNAKKSGDPSPGFISNVYGSIINKFVGSKNKTQSNIQPSIDSEKNLEQKRKIFDEKNNKISSKKDVKLDTKIIDLSNEEIQNKSKIHSTPTLNLKTLRDENPNTEDVKMKSEKKINDEKSNNKPENTTKQTNDQPKTSGNTQIKLTKELSIEIAKKFVDLRKQKKNDEAGEMLTEDTIFETPQDTFKTKKTVIEAFNNVDSKLPDIKWNPNWTTDSNYEVYRTGSFSKMFMTFNIEQRIFLTEKGLIKKLTMKKL